MRYFIYLLVILMLCLLLIASVKSQEDGEIKTLPKIVQLYSVLDSVTVNWANDSTILIQCWSGDQAASHMKSFSCETDLDEILDVGKELKELFK